MNGPRRVIALRTVLRRRRAETRVLGDGDGDDDVAAAAPAPATPSIAAMFCAAAIGVTEEVASCLALLMPSMKPHAPPIDRPVRYVPPVP